MLNRSDETMVPAKGTLCGRRIHVNRQETDHICYECGEPIWPGTEYFYEVWRIESWRPYRSYFEYRRVHACCPNKQ